MTILKPIRIKSITEGHRLAQLPKPHHPLVSIIDVSGLKNNPEVNAVIFDFYVVSLKRGCDKLIYGQQRYDFDEGLMAFMAPGQILRGEENGVPVNLEELSTTDLSVSEIAYELGFEHSQSFSKFFKSKTHQSPVEFRQSFN